MRWYGDGFIVAAESEIGVGQARFEGVDGIVGRRMPQDPLEEFDGLVGMPFPEAQAKSR
jgi:hypothetical protein